jgi:hypothetical protein
MKWDDDFWSRRPIARRHPGTVSEGTVGRRCPILSLDAAGDLPYNFAQERKNTLFGKSGKTTIQRFLNLNCVGIGILKSKKERLVFPH